MTTDEIEDYSYNWRSALSEIDSLTSVQQLPKVEDNLNCVADVMATAMTMHRQLGESIHRAQRALQNARAAFATNRVIMSARQEVPLQPTGQLVDMDELAKELGISKTTIWRIRRAGDFPKPVSVSARRVVFYRSDIDEWLRSRKLSLTKR